MKQKTLLLLGMTLFISVLYAQKKQQTVKGFAITAQEKGGRSWKEVRLVDMNTGEELKSIYQSKQEMEALNARTGKPVQKKSQTPGNKASVKKVVNLDMELEKASGNTTKVYTIDENRRLAPMKAEVMGQGQAYKKEANKVIMVRTARAVEMQTDKPFATNSAAMAYDKKHERLYYTPMGINQLRYIDLKSKTPRLYYFEDEPFGKVAGLHDAPNQITRMVIASDGNGYALTNDGNHLIRFTTGKKPVITDLGSLTDDANNKISVHSRSGYGGDMVADKSGNLYLITANRNVFKINIESMVANYKGAITGLPRGFSTNGAMVEAGSKVIVASSESTTGYFRFDLNTLQAEKVSGEGVVFNASDLANGNLAFDKKKDRKEEPEVKEVVVEEVTQEAERPTPEDEVLARNKISVYPNPAASNSFVKLSFDNQPLGKYQVQLFDLSGRTIRSQEFAVQARNQVVDFGIPEIAKGSYLIKIFNEANKISSVNKIVVQ
ncbi:MAG TPA: T9SS type A sorting domain-containing protein [Chitinophagaceae bacterium]|nr:T9SS type A sorting domain-containing protein [Chitinophagaceae bacterium]